MSEQGDALYDAAISLYRELLRTPGHRRDRPAGEADPWDAPGERFIQQAEAIYPPPPDVTAERMALIRRALARWKSSIQPNARTVGQRVHLSRTEVHRVCHDSGTTLLGEWRKEQARRG